MTTFISFIVLVTSCCMLAFSSFPANALPVEPGVEGKASGTAIIGGSIGFENRKLTASLHGGATLRGLIAGLVNMGRNILEMVRGRRELDGSLSENEDGGSNSDTGEMGSTTSQSLSGSGESGSMGGTGGINSFESLQSGSMDNVKQISSNGGSVSYFRRVNGGGVERTNGVSASSIEGLSSLSNIASRRVVGDRSSWQGVEGRDGMQFANGADIDGGMNKLTNENSQIMDSGATDRKNVMRINNKTKIHITRKKTNSVLNGNEAAEETSE